MKRAPTLIDEVYRVTFNKKLDLVRHPAELRQKLQSARRFVLDGRMSEFLYDLSSASFRTDSSAKIRHKLIEQMREGARLPHALTWIEYDLFRYQTHQWEVQGDNLGYVGGLMPPPNPGPPKRGDVPDTEGWLLEQHPSIDTAFRAHLFTSSSTPDHKGYTMWMFPWTYQWSTDAQPLPWRAAVPRHFGRGHFQFAESDQKVPASSVIAGLIGYDTDLVSVDLSHYATYPRGDYSDEITAALVALLAEWSGVVRRMWALLTTINDIPILQRDVVASKGFVAKGSYRRFLDHKVLTLHVPEKRELHKLARSIVAAARRRAHQVRGHWRDDWRHPPSRLCDTPLDPFSNRPRHDWNEDNICRACKGHRLWIHEHQRGDASLGFVLHDYAVTHD